MKNTPDLIPLNDLNSKKVSYTCDKPMMSSLLQGQLTSPDQLALLASKLEAITDSIGASENIDIEVVPQGLRILLRDNAKHKMFRRGSAQMTPFFQDVLRALAPVFIPIENRKKLFKFRKDRMLKEIYFFKYTLSQLGFK